jgi:predicted DNA binding CopG/RHH family protein
MLQDMEQPAQNSPSASSSGFAGLLASLTSPLKEQSDHAASWNNGELADDVVTLSYERALRNHARYRLPDDGDLRLPVAVDDNVDGAAGTTTPDAIKKRSDVTQADAAPRTAAGSDRRSASVTIRLSDTECSRVRQRAAEAGLTVSAYLRSCVLEADVLRAQVKQALAEIKTATGQESAADPRKKPRLGWFGRIARRR